MQLPAAPGAIDSKVLGALPEAPRQMRLDFDRPKTREDFARARRDAQS